MKLVELLNTLNKGYPDGFLSIYYDEKGRRKKGSGDGLAKFIVDEVIVTYDIDAPRDKQIGEAKRVLEKAIRELQSCVRELI